MNTNAYLGVLEKSLRAASERTGIPEAGIPADISRNVDILVGWKNISPLTVLLTSLVKKSVDPEQDIRLHRAEFLGGYSGRGLDTKTVTPFLEYNGFPHMKESGWLTRSFEQAHPYDLGYPGKISGRGVKDAFLRSIDTVERGAVDPDALIVYMFWRLIQRRDKENVALSKPTNLAISEIVSCLGRHFSSGGSGKARLPVLAIYAVYQQMIGGSAGRGEVSRYKNMRLYDLESHTSADSKSGAVGDVEVVDPDRNVVFEAVEIKHGQVITVGMIRNAYGKFRSHPIDRYYMLTTVEGEPIEQITEEVIRIQKEHGCQVIVNGVLETLKYYLRLLKTPAEFVANYVSLVEKDPALKYEHKIAWDNIVNGCR